MHDMVADPLAGLIEGRMHEAIAAGADVAELAAIAVDAVMTECVALLEVHAAGQCEPAAKASALDCAERLMAAQFGGWTPALTRN